MNQNDFSTKFKEISLKQYGQDAHDIAQDITEKDNLTVINKDKDEPTTFQFKDYAIMNVPMDAFCYFAICVIMYFFVTTFWNINRFQDPIIALKPGFTFATLTGLLPSVYYFFSFY